MKLSQRKSIKEANIRKLSLAIGNFIRYWGFRKIHGAVWTQLYLSKTPLSCSELTKRLKLSKALISPALSELCSYGLIFEEQSSNQKLKIYSAKEDVSTIILKILKSRELNLIKQVNDLYFTCEGSDFINDVRFVNLGEMIYSANLMLNLLVNQKDIFQVTSKVKI